MTTLASWVTYSKTGEKPELPRAIYIVSDSRITWGSQSVRWDAGRKVFNSQKKPHVFGYCGDVVFPSLVLGQIISAIDNEILFESQQTPDEKHESILHTIKTSYKKSHNNTTMDFSIVHAYRSHPWPHTEFLFWHISYKAKTNEWFSNKVDLPKETGIIVSLGSGAPSAENHGRSWQNSDVGGTSRSFFSAFCDSISSGDDRLSGGTPQLVALYTKLPAKSIGIIKDNRYFLHGMEIQPNPMLSNIEWKDELFRDVNPSTNNLKQGARPFVKPKLKKK
ncbi:hypothetical protein FRZ67_02930 [Panacibacter ginsenosidivorans]|uniref:Uncharacterized protein n=1 Tax=Panacibacter ginsenosidivorans TaxID=1813871 RepID=A0A5B8V4K6_9BACT|nr:hypothetical protein [Panacibacter ginsenosidivorans]QEC66310.1 hypothetical protein FRZ67_02930 [Panacibacter ginsenosidivorans]